MQVAFRSAAVMLFMLSVTATANAQKTPVPKKEREFFSIRVRDDQNIPEFQLRHALQDVWQTLPTAFEQLGYPGAVASSDDYTFLTPYMNIKGRLYDGERNSKYLDCGNSPSGTPAADIYSVTFVIVTRVEAHPEGGSRLRVLIDGDARDKALSSNSVPCRGTGLLEGGIAQFIDQQLRQ